MDLRRNCLVALYLILSFQFLAGKLFPVPLPTQVQSIYPGQNGTFLSGDSAIFVEFSHILFPSSVNENSFHVLGEQVGEIAGTFTIQANRVEFVPSEPFVPGEVVSVSLSPQIKFSNNGGIDSLPTAFQWSFNVAPQQGFAHFKFADSLVVDQDIFQTQLADVDADGFLDALVCSNGPFQIWHGIGKGCHPVQVDSFSDTVTQAKVSDLDSDGDLDVFSLASCHLVPGIQNTAKVMLNQGNGAYIEHFVIHSGAPSQTIELGDLDGDGDVDAAILGVSSPSSNCQYSIQGICRIYLNDGAGHFSELVSSRLDSLTLVDLAIGDMDSDGDLDLVSSIPSGWEWFENMGGAQFVSGGKYFQNYIRELHLKDFNQDGRMDVMVMRSLQNSPNMLYQQTANGGFSPQNLGAHQSRKGAVGDVDGDGDLDMIWGVQSLGGGGNRIWMNDGSFTQTLPIGDCAMLPIYAISLGDLDRDGDLDALLSSGKTNRVLLNNCPANFPSFPAVPLQSFCPGDTPRIELSVVNSDYRYIWYREAYGEQLAEGSISGIRGEFFQPTHPASDTVYVKFEEVANPGCRSIQRYPIVLHEHAMPAVSFTNFSAEVCAEDEPLTLTTDYPGGTFSGTGIHRGMLFPDELGENNLGIKSTTVYYQFVDSISNCPGQISESVRAYPSPEAVFHVADRCWNNMVFRDESMIAFQDSIVGWNWDFGDSSKSILPNPQHAYDTLDSFLVQLEVVTGIGCRDTTTEVVVPRAIPQVTILNEEGALEVPLTLRANVQTSDSIQSWKWAWNGTPFSNSPAPTMIPQNIGSNLLTLEIATRGGCQNNDSSFIYVHPRITSFPSYEDFENAAIPWAVRGTENTWMLGKASNVPPAIGVDLVPGDHIWHNSNGGRYQNGENSWLVSHSYDFSFASNPMLEFDYWFDTEPRVDGWWIEYSTDFGISWNQLGALDDPLNWYNDKFFPSFGSESAAFSGNSGGWKHAAHSLGGLAGEINVLFRLLFASNHTQNSSGVAINNFQIREKGRKVLLESCLDETDARSLIRMDSFAKLKQEFPHQLYVLPYRFSNLLDSEYGNKARCIYYRNGEGSGRTYVNGGEVPRDVVLDSVKVDALRKIVIASLLQPSLFSIEIKPFREGAGQIELETTVRYLGAQDTILDDPLRLRQGLVTLKETEVQEKNGYLSLKAMDPVGVALDRRWEVGQAREYIDTVKINHSLEEDSLAQLVFLQEDKNQQILQVARGGLQELHSDLCCVDSSITLFPEVDTRLLISPNPVLDDCSISVPGDVIKSFKLVNSLGEVLLVEHLHEETYVLQMQNLNPGYYIILVETVEGSVFRSFVVKA